MKRLVLFFDNDEAGRQAAQECAELLPPGKAKIARLEKYKDASDALQAGDSEAIRRAIWDAKHTDQTVSLMPNLTRTNHHTHTPADHDYPFQGLQRKLHGIRYGELVTITAGSGTGKSSSVGVLQVIFCKKRAGRLLGT